MPNTIADNLQRLTAARTAIGNAIVTKGGTVNSGDGLEEFPSDIMSIKNDLTSIDITENGTYYGGEETVVTSSTFPVAVNDSNGTPIRHVDINGNAVQDGTPTPDSPVDVNGVGVRTENLFDINSTATTFNCLVSVNDNVLTQTNSGIYARSIWKVDNLVIGAKYTVHVTANNPNSCSFRLNVMDSTDSTVIASGNTYTDSRSYFILFTATETTHIIRIYSNTTITGSTSTIVFSNIMLNAGSTVLPYEPYGYKNPISNDQQTTNIYLGSTQTTRQIKKLVMTGEEGWQRSSDYTYYIGINDYLRTRAITSMSTHYIGQTNVSSGEPIAEGSCCFYYGPGANILYLKTITPYSTLQDFKTWLATEYANGTPVIVWYVLETPQTAVVNEPLMKIGNYADSLSVDVELPLSQNAKNNIDIDTTLKPSEVTVNYKGWHPVMNGHESESGQWD